MDVSAALSNNKVTWGLMALCVNLGSRYLLQDVTRAQEAIFNHPLFKRFVLFAIVFLATRDILLAAAITSVACVCLTCFLNEGSRYCIVPRPLIGRDPTPRPRPFPAR